MTDAGGDGRDKKATFPGNEGEGRPTALVTGATGFTGEALARELVRRGYDIRALVRPDSRTEKLDSGHIHLHQGDLRNPEDIEQAAEGVDYIYHIAAAFRPAGQPDSYYHDVNVGGVENVIRAARAHEVSRTVHCSTVGVHGNVKSIPATEDSPYNPGDIYQETKLEGELVAREAFERDVPGVVVRPAGIYGPGDLRFLKLFRAIQNRRFIMFGSGETLYHFTYIDDLVDGIILCGEHPDALGEVYIVAGDEFVTLNQLAELVAEAVGATPPQIRLPFWLLMGAAVACETLCKPLGIDPPLYRRRAEFFIKDRAFSNEKIKEELGYAPKISLDEGIKRTAKWYFEGGHLSGEMPGDLKDSAQETAQHQLK